MTSFEKGIVNALEQMGDTDWIGVIFNITRKVYNFPAVERCASACFTVFLLVPQW